MKTNLIQNYITSTPMNSGTAQTKQPEKKTVPNFSIQEQLNNRTFIKPLKSKGKLVRTGLFDAPAIFVKDTIYSAKALKHGLDGSANDHELGKLNDLGLKIGGLAIASYLFTKRNTAQTKLMEFVGLGSFLASMALWPKLAIQLPAKLIHGVNVHQQYEDSFGRKKPFYQDPQFVPWSLYSDKEINKIGDRLGVPRNINNRRDVIQEKMKKIAVQSNTLWMLTAGFATPVMGSLMSMALSKPILDWQNSIKNKNAKSLLTNFDKNAAKYQSNETIDGLNRVLEANKDAIIDEKMLQKITSALSEGLDPITSKAIETDLRKILIKDDFTFINTSAAELNKNIVKVLMSEDYSEEIANMITPTETEFLDYMKNNNLIDSIGNSDKQKELISKLFEPIKAKIAEYNRNLPEGASAIDADEIADIRGILVSKSKDINPFKQTFAHGSTNILNHDTQAYLRNIANILTDFKAQTAVLDEYAFLKVASAPETNIAYNWNKASESLLNTLGITGKELEKARFDRELMAKLIQGKIEQIAGNKELYQSTMQKIIDAVAKLDTDINIDKLYSEKVDTVFAKFANSFANLNGNPMENLARTLNGVYFKDGIETQLPSCLKEIQKNFVNNRLLGVKSSFFRLISTLDMYRRIATQDGTGILTNPAIPREIKEEVVELCQRIMTQGHSSDFAVKFYHPRNPNPNLSDCSNVEIKNGKMIRKYGLPPAQRVDIPQDCTFFQKVMDVMFGEDIHPETRKLLQGKNLSDAMDNYRHRMYSEVGGDSYFAKPFHMPSTSKGSTSKTRFLLTGIAPDELFYKIGKQTYNTKKWLKMFGGFGAGLLAVTIGSQFFFGKIKYPQANNIKSESKGA